MDKQEIVIEYLVDRLAEAQRQVADRDMAIKARDVELGIRAKALNASQLDHDRMMQEISELAKLVGEKDATIAELKAHHPQPLTLNPCRCGCKVIVIYYDPLNPPDVWSLYCNNDDCHFQGNVGTTFTYPTITEAAANWQAANPLPADGGEK